MGIALFERQVSCVGALGSADDETANGLANVKVAEAAKAARSVESVPL